MLCVDQILCYKNNVMYTKIFLRLLLSFSCISFNLTADYSAVIQINQQEKQVFQQNQDQKLIPSGKINILAIIINFPFIIDQQDNTDHEHEDGKFHIFYFDRIRRRASRLSIRCLLLKCLLAIIHVSIILFIHHHLIC